MPDTQRMPTRLTPLADVFAALDAGVRAVMPRELAVGDAQHCILAADVAGRRCPAAAVALQDGWAVNSAELADAGGYAPAVLATGPVAVETGDPMPPGTDAVTSPETVTRRGDIAEATSAVAPGEGVLPAGGDCDPARPLRMAGQRLRAGDLAALAAAGISRVNVRLPRVKLLVAREDPRLRPALDFIARDCRAQGGSPFIVSGADVEQAFAGDDCDALVIVGGSGSGRRDRSIAALARAGRVIVHGIALAPGHSAALGDVGGRPVLVVPGRLDAAIAVWLAVGRRMMSRLTNSCDPVIAPGYSLGRKVTSTVGIVDIVPVRIDGEMAEPLASKFLPLTALTRADGYLVVPADSEGFAPGTKVAVYPWP